MRRLTHVVFVCSLTLIAVSCGKGGAGSIAATAQGVAQLSAPANGQSGINPISPIQFSWNAVPSAEGYSLYVGTRPGAKDIYNSGEVTITTLTVNLQALTTYYARLWTKLGTVWYYADSTFATGVPHAAFLSPVNGASGVDAFASITWTPDPDADSFAIYIGPEPDGSGLYFSYPMPASVTSRLPWGLQPNTPYYATLWVEKSGVWTKADNIQFVTGSAVPTPDRTSFYANMASLTGQVRGMTIGPTNLAAPGTVLYQTELDRFKDPTQPGADCTDYAFTLLSVFTSNRVLARYRGISLNGPDSHAITEYWDPFTKGWTVADATFGVVYFDSTSQTGWSADAIGAALRSGTAASVPRQYVSPYYDTFNRNYYMDPITLFNNLNPTDSDDYISNAVNAPETFLNAVNISDVVGQNQAFTAKFGSSSESFSVQYASGATYTFNPDLPSLWSWSQTLWLGWSAPFVPPSDMQLYSYKWLFPYAGIAHLSGPANNDVVDSWGGVNFSWESVANAAAYKVQVGTSLAGNDVYDSGAVQTTTVTAPVQSSSSYYVRLSTQLGSQWYYDDTKFSTIPAISHLLMPANGATNVAPSPVNFTWTTVSGGTYYLYVGTAPGLKDAYDSGELQSSSVSVPLSSGTRYYVQMWTELDSTWYHSDTSFQTN